MKVKNVGILFHDFGPYHITRINSLARALEFISKEEENVIAFRFSETGDTYSWIPQTPKGINTVTLAKKFPSGILQEAEIAIIFFKKIIENKVAIVFLPSYAPLPNFLCVISAKIAGCKLVLMNESWAKTEKASFFGKLVKKIIVSFFSAAIVGGNPQKEYAHQYGLKMQNIFLGYDIIDNSYFKEQSTLWRNKTRSELPINIPYKFFLNLGRFAKKKNLEVLIHAYSKFVKTNTNTQTSLILVGEGIEEFLLRDLCDVLGLEKKNYNEIIQSEIFVGVIFFPFQQIQLTPLFFSYSECFILPSMYEEWGLVVNEAMACGTSVIVSENVGCAYDLIEQGFNGFTFNPTDVNSLATLLNCFENDDQLSTKLGLNGQKYIDSWGPQKFTDSAISILNSLSK